MKQILSRCIGIAALTMLLCLYVAPDLALAAGKGWQTLVDEHAALTKQGQHKRALEVAQEMLTLAEADPNKDQDQKNVGQSLYTLAFTYRNLAQYHKALPILQRALAIREKTLGPEHPGTVFILNHLAHTYNNLGQYDKALPLQQRALEINENALKPGHPDIAWSLNNLASTYRHLALYDRALPLQQRALAMREKVLGPEHPDTAWSLNNLASTYGHLAQHDKALPLRQRALTIFEKTCGPEHPDTAAGLNSLASTYGRLGQHDKALPLRQRALLIIEKARGPEHPNTAWSLNNLATTDDRLGWHDKALPLRQRALAIFEKTVGSAHPDTATSLNNLATTYGNLAQHDKALPLQKRALAIHENVLGPEHPDTAWSLNNLASIYSHLEYHDKALPLQQRALAIREKVLGPDHPDTAWSLNNLAGTFIQMGQPDLAIAFYKFAVNIYQSQREQVSRIDAPALRSYTESVTATYQALANLLIDQGLLPEAQLVLDMLKEHEQFEFIRRSSSADPRLTRLGYNSTEKIWMTRYRQIADRLVALGAEEQALQKQAKSGLSTKQKQRQQRLSSDLRVAQTAFESFLKEMRENFARQGPARAAEASATSLNALDQLQGLLKGIGHDAVLLQYYVTDDKVGMLLTTSGVQLARSTKVSARELNRQIAAFRRLLRDPKSDPMAASQALYQLLVAPVVQDLEQAGAKTVMLSLDGALRYLPFSALHDGQHYLMQHWNLPMYTSVTRDRLRDAAAAQWQAAGLGVTRALGDFAALPAVKTEMRSIIKTSDGGVLPGEIYLNEAFTAQRFKDVSQRPFQLLHVASHFRFSPGTEVNSFLLLGDGQQLTLGDIRAQNYRFDNVDLLTLSACDTGLGGGRDARGREIEGFGVIAQQQGAKAVLATLWPVADRSTAMLMADMYRRRQEQSLTKIEALRQAQLSLLAQNNYAHPFYWAPFILMGNWK
jgi:CHAT domain-containing protein